MSNSRVAAGAGRWGRRLAWVVLALALVASVSAGLYAWRATPPYAGRLALPGAAAELRIERDADGVPTIRAASLRDAAYGLGVAHAQDRLWQLETHRRIAAGRLAEAFGAGALDTDRFLRALAVRRAAEAQWQTLGAEARELLAAYAAGVNAVIATATPALPPEFLILGVRPEPWTPVDSLGWALMMAWDLGGNWSTELLRLRLALRLPTERVAALLPPPDPREPAPATADYAALYRALGLAAPAAGAPRAALPGLERLAAIAPPSGVEGVGSNNWVLSGARSATGAPLLANDPHLKLSAPSLWYLARLEVPGLRVAGATMPGLPGVVLGQNGDIAWGFTNTGPDVQDLYLEQVDPADPARYRTPEGWAAFATRRETIKVKDRPDVEISVRSTRHGPVISDAGVADDLTPPAAGAPHYVLALRWTALDPDHDPVTPALRLQRSRSVDEFVAAVRGWVAPMQNMVVADRAGRIGFVAPGRVPLRGPDNDLRGLVPAPGWETRYDWTGFLPADETPREFDPRRGFIATANARVATVGDVHYLTSEWAAPWRQQRIEALLAAREKHTLDDLAAIQADQTSLAAQALLPFLLRARTPHPLADAARAELAAFDGRMDAGRAAPLIFWAWQRQLAEAVFADDAGTELWKRSLRTRSHTEALLRVLREDDASWCDDRGTPAPETCAQQADAALTRALAELQARFGPELSGWRWGQAHQARAEHRPFSRVPVLAWLFERRAPVGGDTHTVNVGRVGLREEDGLYLDEHGPGYRALYDLADPARSRVANAGAQSGLPWARRARADFAEWAALRYRPLWPAVGERAPPVSVLVVSPVSGTVP